MKTSIKKFSTIIVIFSILLLQVQVGFTEGLDRGFSYDRNEFVKINQLIYEFGLDNNQLPTAQRIKNLDISKELLGDISTDGLLDIILQYPLLVNIIVYDDINMGLESLINSFTPLNEFLKREDARNVVENKYLELKNIDEYFIKRTFIQALGHKLNYKYKEIDSLTKTNKDSPRYNSTYVTTPKGTSVEVLILGEQLSDYDKASINKEVERAYPLAIRLREPTTNYNCHSYAWYSTSVNNKYWMNSPVAYYADESYTETTSSNGTKAIYFAHPNITVAKPIHSVRVEGNVFVSKWGQAGLYKHLPDYSPYNADAPYIKYFK